MQEEHHPKSLLQEEGLFPLVKAQKLNIRISPRKQVMSCRENDGGAGGPGVPGRERGTKEREDQTHE